MCGIAGIFRFDGRPVEEQELSSLARLLAHRGPDGQGVFRSDSVGLVHTRLAIIDLEHGGQPMVNHDESLALVVNGEIYNYVELKEMLRNQGASFQTRSDSEVILHLYNREFPLQTILKQLNGMFAFALYDAVSKKLPLGRDRLGIKPLFYCRRPEGLYFASEIKALLGLLPGSPELRPAALGQILQSNFDSGEETLVKGIRRLPAGCFLSLDSAGHGDIQAYWNPATDGLASVSLEGVLDSLIPTVMKEHLRADVPLGLFLSGGLDSSTLLALLSRHHNHTIHTYSVGFRSAKVHSGVDLAEYLQPDRLRSMIRGQQNRPDSYITSLLWEIGRAHV